VCGLGLRTCDLGHFLLKMVLSLLSDIPACFAR